MDLLFLFVDFPCASVDVHISIYIYIYIYIYICVYIYIGGLGGELALVVSPSNREIDFDFVSCSCRACERAGEAKLCGRVREQCFPTLVPRMVRCSAAAAAAPAVLWSFRFCCYAHVFFDFLSFLDAMLMGFLICFRFCCYAHGFFDVFVHLLRFRCYAHGFFDLFVFLLLCSWFF